MRTALALAALGGIVASAGGAMLAAPGQSDRPGQISQNKVWVENRGRGEAVAVAIQEVTTATPIGVQVIGTPTVMIAPSNVVQARLVRQQWEYPDDHDPARRRHRPRAHHRRRRRMGNDRHCVVESSRKPARDETPAVGRALQQS